MCIERSPHGVGREKMPGRFTCHDCIGVFMIKGMVL